MYLEGEVIIGADGVLTEAGVDESIIVFAPGRFG